MSTTTLSLTREQTEFIHMGTSAFAAYLKSQRTVDYSALRAETAKEIFVHLVAQSDPAWLPQKRDELIRIAIESADDLIDALK